MRKITGKRGTVLDSELVVFGERFAIRKIRSFESVSSPAFRRDLGAIEQRRTARTVGIGKFDEGCLRQKESES